MAMTTDQLPWRQKTYFRGVGFNGKSLLTDTSTYKRIDNFWLDFYSDKLKQITTQTTMMFQQTFTYC